MDNSNFYIYVWKKRLKIEMKHLYVKKKLLLFEIVSLISHFYNKGLLFALTISTPTYIGIL